MENSTERIDSSKNQENENKSTVDSAILINPENSELKLSKLSFQNFIQRSSPVIYKPINNLSLSIEEINNLNDNIKCNNMNFLSYYSSITPKILPKELRILSTKNFPSKEQVCKGNTDLSKKIKIPTSNAITQYFNLDNILKNDSEKQLETKYDLEEHTNKKINEDKSINFNCSSSPFIDKQLSNDLESKEFILNDDDEHNHKNNKENGDNLLTDNIENVKQNNNENNDIHNKIKTFKLKKLRGKPKSNKKKKHSNNLSENENINYIIDNKNDKSLGIIEKKKTGNIYDKDSLNIFSDNITEENTIDNNINDYLIDKNSYFKSSEKINIYLDKNEDNNIQKIFPSKETIMEEVYFNNVNENKFFINNKTNNFNYNDKLRNNNMNNYMNFNNKNIININKINYSNLNIFNGLKIEQNLKDQNIEYQDGSQLYYLNINNKDENNFSNINNNTSDSKDKNIVPQISQMKGIYMNLNTYFPNININQNYSFFNNINNNLILNNVNKKINKFMKLDKSFYIDKPLSFLGNNFFKLSKDQGACRYLQKLLDSNPQEALYYLYGPLCENILPLINYPFANYLIQKIIIYLNQEQLYEILNKISINFLEICNNIYGTRVIQTIINNIKSPKVTDLFYQLLKPKIIDLYKSLYGTFVVQNFIKMFKNYANEINDIVVDGSLILSTHNQGYYVIKKYIALKDPYLMPKLVDKLIDKSLQLIVDQYGNYVIQSILRENTENFGNKLSEKIVENVVYYAKNKYSSNVVRKLFDYCNGIYLLNLMKEVQKKENLIELILDIHGNYIAQKVIKLSNPLIQNQMLKIIKQNMSKLKNYSHGASVINRLIHNYPFITDKNFLDDSKRK